MQELLLPRALIPVRAVSFLTTTFLSFSFLLRSLFIGPTLFEKWKISFEARPGIETSASYTYPGYQPAFYIAMHLHEAWLATH